MNVKSRFVQEEPEAREPKKSYIFLGYGGYNTRGGGQLGVGSYIRSPRFFDSIFEMISLKKKPKHRRKGKSNSSTRKNQRMASVGHPLFIFG